MSVEEYNERRRLEQERQLRRRRATARPSKELRDEIQPMPCAVCGRRGPSEIHHLVPQAKFSRTRNTRHARPNLLPVCHRCHQDHHTTTKRIPRRCLSPEAVEFIVTRTSLAWLDLWYPA